MESRLGTVHTGLSLRFLGAVLILTYRGVGHNMTRLRTYFIESTHVRPDGVEQHVAMNVVTDELRREYHHVVLLRHLSRENTSHAIVMLVVRFSLKCFV